MTETKEQEFMIEIKQQEFMSELCVKSMDN